jgi:hypothetical protein
MKPIEVTVKNNVELQHLMENENYEISKSIVYNIIENLNTKKKKIHIMSITCEEDQTIYDLTLERKNFIDTLERNLIVFEKHEDYEGCVNIQKSITHLKFL